MRGDKVWALILAAGDGTRLSSLTTMASGLRVPKQFCSLRGGCSLLEEALARAESVTARPQVMSVVADQHRRWWEQPLASLPPDNVVVQPENRGTAAGLLLPLLHIVERDPDATVIVLPSDHYFIDEAPLARTLRRVSRLAHGDVDHVYLLGLDPSEPDPDLGYIVPATGSRVGVGAVRRFVEKPSADVARDLIAAGAFLNMFILAASARALVALYAGRHPSLLRGMQLAVAQDRRCPQDAPAARRMYPHLANLDFSRDILAGQESRLRVLAVPACGWSDLGTPRRVVETLARLGGPRRAGGDAGAAACVGASLDLAEQHRRQQAMTPWVAHGWSR